jgi:alpha-ketoglutarate-dependent taurine dioxygenase
MRILKSKIFTDQELVDYARSLSTIVGSERQQLLHWDFGAVMTIRFDPAATNYLFSEEAVPFHWDGAFYREPRFLLFYCLESGGAGGETLFADTEKIWASLSATERERCGLVRLIYRTKKVAHYGGEITVPLLQAHPETGNPILRIAERVETARNPVDLEVHGFAGCDDFFRGLVEKLYRDEFLVEHRWEAGDLVVVDNFTYLHGRRALAGNRGRTFKRVQIL